MTKSRIKEGVVSAYVGIEKAVVDGYKAIEEGVVKGYKAIETSTVESYQRIEDTAVRMGKSLMEEYAEQKIRTSYVCFNISGLWFHCHKSCS